MIDPSLTRAISFIHSLELLVVELNEKDGNKKDKKPKRSEEKERPRPSKEIDFISNGMKF